jgi:hypothetical protein
VVWVRILGGTLCVNREIVRGGGGGDTQTVYKLHENNGQMLPFIMTWRFFFFFFSSHVLRLFLSFFWILVFFFILFYFRSSCRRKRQVRVLSLSPCFFPPPYSPSIGCEVCICVFILLYLL